MSFQIVRNGARSRFAETQVFLNHLTAIEPNDPTTPDSLEFKIMKGLFHVQLYSALEKTVNEIIENTLTYIGATGVKNIHYAIPFNTISLVDKLKSFKDCGYNNFFNKAIEIFEELTSQNVSSINESAFSNNLQNVWTKTIDEVIKAFGIKGFVIDPRTRTTIDELVEKRNAVAHGRESAAVVGERFRTDVLRAKSQLISDFAFQLIDLFDDYYSNKNFLKGNAKKHYAVV
jgi:hypothetical protein